MPDQIEIKPGRELDIFIAELKTGRSRYESRVDPTNRNGEPQFFWGYPAGHDFAPNYSTDNEVAQAELCELRKKHSAQIHKTIHRNLFFCTIDGPNGAIITDTYSTRALAICDALIQFYSLKKTEKSSRNGQFPQNQHPVNDATERLIEPSEIW